MVNMNNHQRNANQNHNERSPHACQNSYHQKEQQTTNAGKDMVKPGESLWPQDHVDWRAIVHEVTESDMTEHMHDLVN